MVIDSNKKLKNFYAQKFGDIRANEELVEQTSKYFGEIGSTPLEDIPYAKQVDVKKEALVSTFSNEGLSLDEDLINQIEVVKSPITEEYRLKMEYVTSYDPFHEPNSRFGQRKKGSFNWVIDMDESNLISNEWFKKLRKLYEKFQELEIRNYDLVKQDGNLRYLVLRCQNENAMVSIITKLDDDLTRESVKRVAELALELGFKSIYWNVNSTAGDRADGELMQIWGETEMKVEMYNLRFLINPQTFFQNNILGFEVLLEYVEEKIKGLVFPPLSEGRWPQAGGVTDKERAMNILYDLYSGVGTLGIIFAKYFEKVIGFEIVGESVRLAKENMKLNGVDNYEISQADLNKPETIDSNLIIPNQVLIVDPPRIGLEKNGVNHILKLEPKYIIYISCNPITQLQDLIMLKDKYEVTDVRGFDLFPHTFHMENVTILGLRDKF